MTATPSTQAAPAAPDGAAAPAVLAKFVLLAVIWGSSFLLVKVALERFPALHVSFGRMIFGTATLLVVLKVTGQRLPRGRRTWGHLMVAAVLLNSIPFSLVAYAETEVSSALAGIWNATTPLMTLLVVLAWFPEERPSKDRIAGLVAGFVGVVLVLGLWRGPSGGQLIGQAALFGMALCYGLGTPYTRRYLSQRGEGLVPLACAQLICGTLQLAVVFPAVAGVPPLPFDRSLAALVALGALGTGLAYILYYGLMRDMGAAGASGVTYVQPVVAGALGVLVLGETLSWNHPVGAVVVLVGVALSQGRLKRCLRRRRRATSR